MVTSLPFISLSLSLYLSLSLSPKAPNAQYRKRFRASYNIEKEIVREVARGDKPDMRKSSDRKAQISPLSWTNAFLICALRSVDFLM